MTQWKEFDRESRKAGLRAGGWIVLVLVFFLLLGLGGWGFKVLFADAKGSGDVRIQTKGNADYRISAYDRFFDDCAAIQSKEDQIKNLEIEGKTAAADRQTQINSSITALRNSRATLIRQYNADARKEDTRASFRASDLPYNIDPEVETTTCAP